VSRSDPVTGGAHEGPTDGEGPAGEGPADSLELLAEQDGVLVKIFEGWDATTPAPGVEDTRVLVRSGFDRGTWGKLLIEHAALRVAAKTDVARVLYDADLGDLADELTEHLPEVRKLLDRLDELARGVNPMGVAASAEFAGAVGQLAALLRADLVVEAERTIPRIAAALGADRSKLHRAQWVHQHAPTHPSPEERWYDHIPVLVRIQARYDHLRGFPWPRSTPMANPKVADPIEDQA
jgi:hypothetical protein